MAVNIFVCYAHKDRKSLEKLETRLKPLQYQGLIKVWWDRDISAGSEWEPEIKKKLEMAQIILLLVSPEFMASEYCYGVEMKRAIEKHEREEACVIPIILRPCLWQISLLSKLQALPRNGKPIIGPGWHNQDEAFFDVAKGIKALLEHLTTESYM